MAWDTVDHLLLRRAVENQNMIGGELQSQITALLVHNQNLAAALTKEQDHTRKLRNEVNEFKGIRARLLQFINKQTSDHKAEKSGLDGEISNLRTQLTKLQAKVAELNDEHRQRKIGYAVKCAENEGYHAQIMEFREHHPDSALIVKGEVPGHPDLSHRSPSRTTYDIAYSASLKESGITLEDLARITTDGYKPGHPVYLDRDPPAQEDMPSGPTP